MFFIKIHEKITAIENHLIVYVQWAAKVMAPASMYFLWKTGS